MSQLSKPLSVVFINFNKKVYLKRSLKNLMGQVNLKGGDEVIVADGGSNDNTERMILKNFAPDVKYYSIKHTPYNLNSVRNLGVMAAKNEIVVIFDADVIPQPECIQRLREEAGQGRFIGGVIIYETDEASLANFLKNHKGEMVPRYFLVGNYPKIDDIIKIVETPKSDKTGTLGGIMCFSKTDWIHVKGFDPVYNGHWGFDETDFILKLHFNGVKVDVFKPIKTATGFKGVFGYHQRHHERKGWKAESMERNRALLASRIPRYREKRFND